MFRKKVYTYGFFSMLAIASLVNVGHIAKGTEDSFEIIRNLSIFGRLYREINANYVDEIDPTKFMRTGIDAMLESLDPYTNFISASEIEDMRFMSTGSYEGVGASVNERNGKYIVTEAYEDDPAVQAGIKVGDEITMIDDVLIQGKKNKDIRVLLRGEAGKPVNLTILRPGETEKRVITVMRKEVKIENVPYFGMINDNVGYIALVSFTKDAGKEVRNATTTLKSKNPNLKSIILDVRGNPGGILGEAVNILSVFVPINTNVVETRGRMEGSQNKYPTPYAPVDTSIQLAVLINNRSASASEIVAGALQDLDRAVIVGVKSFGKGLVQTARMLNYETQVKYTTAKYYIPSGRCIQALDYSHRNPDGSVGKIPDSLKRAFKTKHTQRTVYDGIGIEPDIETKPRVLKTVTVELLNQNMIFDYATQYVIAHPTIASARDFQLSEADYQDFVNMVNSKGFKYETPAEKELEKFKTVALEEHSFDALNDSYTSLKNKLSALKNNELTLNKEEIKEALQAEIIKRYYFRRGMIESSFANDEYILTALQVLNNPSTYNRTLGKTK